MLIGRNKCRKMYPAIFFSGLELLSCLEDKSSIVITKIWPQRALSTCQSQDPTGDGLDHHCTLVSLRGAQPRGTGDLDMLLSWKMHYQWENLKTRQRHPAPWCWVETWALKCLGAESSGEKLLRSCLSNASERKAMPNDILLLSC